ncbi:MAG: hypothetical protein Q7I89_05715 [Syntrophales bacterium]|nr:hypothetical protein [Syntrophales bacterium]
MALEYFIEAYKFATGTKLLYIPFVSDSERPDFVCQTPVGDLVGVEITEVMMCWKIKEEISALGESDHLTAYQASEIIIDSIRKKEEKRSSPNWKFPDNLILFIQVLDIEVDELEKFLLSADLRKDFHGYGFREIWIANFDSVATYRSVTLFGLYPEQIWGPHDRWNQWEKPYG